MPEIHLVAETGRVKGSRPSGRLRRTGHVPGVVYGHGADPVAVSVSWRDLRHALTTDAGLNALIDLDIAGEKQLTIVKDIQRHPVRRDVIHVDFLRISRDEEIHVDVPIVLHGEATHVLREDGVVEQVLFTLPITAKPASIPNEIAIDVSELNVGDTIRVSDLQLPPGVTCTLDLEEGVITARAAVAVEEEAPAEEGAEGEAAAAGEAGEQGAGEAAGADSSGEE